MALTARNDAFQSTLDRFYDALPTKPYCGDMKPAYLIRSKRHALRWNYIQANPPGLTAWLTFDIDHGNCWVWEDAGLPPPNLIVRDKTTNTSHISYAITPVCTSANGRSHPQRYMASIRKAFAARLNADAEYTGRITKNPFSPYWHTTVLHNDEYSLGELADSVDLESLHPAPLSLVPDESHCSGRNSILFQRLRFWSYQHVTSHRTNGSFEQWSVRVQQQAELLNNFRDTAYRSHGALGITEIDATSRSVARWTWDNYEAPQARGVMQLQDADIDLPSKQRLAAQRTHQVRCDATGAAVTDAINALTKANRRVSKAAVARLTGISRQHISGRYSHLFEVETGEAKTVNFAVYQISAPTGPQPKEDIKPDLNNMNKTGNPHSGRVSAKDNQFERLCALLASMARIGCQDGAAVQLGFADRARLARCLLAQGLSNDENEMIACDISAKFVESRHRHMTIQDWIGYAIGYSRNLKQDALKKLHASQARFDAYLRGEVVDLCDSELHSLSSYHKNKIE